MKTLTVEEATPGLGRLVELALAGERIRIGKGRDVVELRPAECAPATTREAIDPREALRRLQKMGGLTESEAEKYLSDVRLERLASEDRRRA